MKVSDWQATPLGYECIIREQDKGEDIDQYNFKRNNILLLLDWLWPQCGLVENKTPIILSEGLTLKISYETLENTKLHKLISEEKLPGEKRSLLKIGRHMASIICNHNGKISSIKAIDSLFDQDKKTRMSINPKDAQKKEDDIVKQKSVAKLLKGDKSKNSDKSHRSNKTSKNPQHTKTVAAASTNVMQGKKKDKKALGARIAPQDSRRAQPIDRIRSAPHEGLSAAAGRGIDLRQFSPMVTEAKNITSVEDAQALPIELGSEDHNILQHLDQLFTHLSCVVAAHNDYVKSINQVSVLNEAQQSEIMSYVAGWHYVHAQITNILTVLSDDHPVKRHLFNQYLYSGKRTYDRQKHEHLPPMAFELHSPTLTNLPTNRCFQDLSAVQAALLLLSEEHYPLQESVVLANTVIQNWTAYIEAEFENYNLARLSANMDQLAFAQWINDTIKNYTRRIAN